MAGILPIPIKALQVNRRKPLTKAKIEIGIGNIEEMKDDLD